MRTLFVLVVLVSVPAWADDKKPEYFPGVKGTKCEYRITIDGKEFDFTTELAEVTTKDGKQITRSDVGVGDVSWTEEISSDEKGAYLHTGAGGKCEPPRIVLKYPLKAGDNWTQKYKEGDAETEAKNTVREPESVEVPAGKFKAFPIDTAITSGGTTVTATTWYAEGTGIVRMTMKRTPKPLTVTLELKKFTPGK